MRSRLVLRGARLAGGVALLLAVLAPSAPAANLVANPGFESPPGAGLTRRYTDPGVPAGFSWAVGGAGVDVVETAWPAAGGAQSVDLNAHVPGAVLTPPGSVSQVLETVPGEAYEIRFWMAGNPDHSIPAETGPDVKTLDVVFGFSVESFSFDVTGWSLANLGWVEKSFTAVATGPFTLLSFTSTNAGYAGPTIDDVTVEIAPPTAAVPMSWGRLKALTR